MATMIKVRSLLVLGSWLLKLTFESLTKLNGDMNRLKLKLVCLCSNNGNGNHQPNRMRMNKTQLTTNANVPKTQAVHQQMNNGNEEAKQTAVQIHEGAHLLNNHNNKNDSQKECVFVVLYTVYYIERTNKVDGFLKARLMTASLCLQLYT